MLLERVGLQLGTPLQAGVTSANSRYLRSALFPAIAQSEELIMDDTIFKDGRDTLLLAFPLIVCVVLSMFRLDSFFIRSSRKSANGLRRPPRGLDENGEPIFTDPDGKVVYWRERRS